MKKEIKITAKDGILLHTTEFLPKHSNGSVILMCGAVGARRKYYADFAEWLAEAGFVVYTFDYRGIGDSRPKSLKGFDAKMQDWGNLDLDAMIRFIKKKWGREELICFCHSMGGQIIGLAKASIYIDRVVMIGSQKPYWWLYPLPFRLKLFASIFFAMPVLSYFYGYFPGKKFKLFSDLPKGVALEWAKWCRSRNALFDYHFLGFYNYLQVPLLAWSFSDDEIAPKNTLDELLKFYPKTTVTRIHSQPSDIGVNSIGHFGFFRKKFEQTLWIKVLGWLKNEEEPVFGKVA